MDGRRTIAITRRRALGALSSAGLAALGAGRAGSAADSSPPAAVAGKALVSITLDLEMSRNFPTWDQTHWDYHKGDLDGPTKGYAREAARRVKAAGGVIHFFALGRTMEQEDVGWLREIAAEGHPVGNHTYDHVNVKATRPGDLQFRFRRAPWLIEGKTPAEVIESNIVLAARALGQRAGIDVAGFRTPGGFHAGLDDRPDLQRLLLKLGYSWVSSKYPAHPIGEAGKAPDAKVLEGIVEVQAQAQPYRYPTGLIELPMSPISDVTAFRSGRWPLDSFVAAIRMGLSWAIERRAVYSLLAHPSCLVATDPEFRAIGTVLELVRSAGDRAALVDLHAVARRVSVGAPR